MPMIPKTIIFPAEEKINLFKPIQVVWRYTWKAEIVSKDPP